MPCVNPPASEPGDEFLARPDVNKRQPLARLILEDSFFLLSLAIPKEQALLLTSLEVVLVTDLLLEFFLQLPLLGFR